MLSTILVLLGIAALIWYVASKQTHAPSLTAEDLAEMNRRIERDAELSAAAVEITSSISSPSVEQIDSTLVAASIVEAPISLDESASTPPEVAAEKAFIQAQQDALVEAQKLAATEVKSSTVETPAVEVKPKKKRRYYPKKK